MIKIDEFLETVERHGSDDLSDSCETCVQIKNGIKIIDESLKLRELIKESIEKRPSKCTKEENIAKVVLQSLLEKSKK